MDAHGAEKPLGQDGGRIGDAPAVRAGRAIDLAPQAGQRAPLPAPQGEVFREVRGVISGRWASSGS